MAVGHYPVTLQLLVESVPGKPDCYFERKIELPDYVYPTEKMMLTLSDEEDTYLIDYIKYEAHSGRLVLSLGTLPISFSVDEMQGYGWTFFVC